MPPLALAATTQQFAQRRQLWLLHDLIEPQVKIHAPALQNMGEQVLHVEPPLFDALLRKVSGTGLEDFEEGLHGRAMVAGLNRCYVMFISLRATAMEIV